MYNESMTSLKFNPFNALTVVLAGTIDNLIVHQSRDSPRVKSLESDDFNEQLKRFYLTRNTCQQRFTKGPFLSQ
jgi:hypothetical protein